MMEPPETLGEAFPREQARCRKLLGIYREVGNRWAPDPDGGEPGLVHTQTMTIQDEEYCTDTGDWFGCYGPSRDDVLFQSHTCAHPAKGALGLFTRIFREMQERGWLKPGSVILDPMGGRGTTAALWCAADPANRAVTIELEPQFVGFQRDNKALAENRMRRALPWLILRGDARKADALLAGDLSSTRAMVAKERQRLYEQWQADWSAESFQPFVPYACTVGFRTGKPKHSAQLSLLEVDGPPTGSPWVFEEWPDLGECAAVACVSSPPYPSGGHHPGMMNTWGGRANPDGMGYGKSEGQIDNLPAAAVCSPTYGAGTIGRSGKGKASTQHERLEALTRDPSSSLYGRDPSGHFFTAMNDGYVGSEGNIDNLPDGPAAAVCSPPYPGAVNDRNNIDVSKTVNPGKTSQAHVGGYGTCEGQIGELRDTPQAACFSPPFENSLNADDPDKRGGLFRDPRRGGDRTMNAGYSTPAACVSSPPWGDSVACQDPNFLTPGEQSKRQPAKSNAPSYGQTEGQIAACVSSQPFEAQGGGSGEASTRGRVGEVIERHLASNADRAYGDGGEAQIGQKQSEDYSSAMRQVYCALARAGIRYVALVTKDPTRGGKLHGLAAITIRLMADAGYRLVAHRRAWLFLTQAQVEAMTGQNLLIEDGGESKKVKGRVSFFRMLWLKRGAVAAAWEDVGLFELDGGGAPLAEVAVCSPPYAGSDMGEKGEGPGAAGNEQQRRRIRDGVATERAAKAIGTGYGAAEGQIGAMRDRPVVAVCSPPYADASVHEYAPNPGGGISKTPDVRMQAAGGYGSSPQQIGNLPDR